jgi:hypothetical protein
MSEISKRLPSKPLNWHLMLAYVDVVSFHQNTTDRSDQGRGRLSARKECAMNRRNVFATLGASVLGLLFPRHQEQPQFGSTVLATSVFSGQGSMNNVDTGLSYKGQKVSPTIVSITPTGFQVTAEVGWRSHHTDTLVDIYITGGNSWTARADYIQ